MAIGDTVHLQPMKIFTADDIGNHLGQLREELDDPTSDLDMGLFAVLSSGKVAEAAITSEFYNDTGNLVGVTAEKYTAANRLAGAMQIQKAIGLDRLFKHAALVECNVYFDGDGDADDQIPANPVGTTVVFHKLTSGEVVADFTTSTASKITGTIVKAKDAPGTNYGRVVVDITDSFVLL